MAAVVVLPVLPVLPVPPRVPPLAVPALPGVTLEGLAELAVGAPDDASAVPAVGVVLATRAALFFPKAQSLRQALWEGPEEHQAGTPWPRLARRCCAPQAIV